MLAITQANTVRLSTTAVSTSKGWPRRDHAMAAAQLAIGPNARNGFEYSVTKCDGLWFWKPTDGIRQPSEAQIKENGGITAFSSEVPTLFAEKVATVLRQLDEDTLQLIADELLDMPSSKLLRKPIQHLAKLLQA